jgi:DNA-binding transcriptional MerR regulator
MDDVIRIGAAATALGVSIDTLRRWERRGRIHFERRGTQRYVAHDELARLLRERAATDHGGELNHLAGIVLDVRRTAGAAEVELACGPYRLVSAMDGAAADRLALRPGDGAVAVLDASTVTIERA